MICSSKINLQKYGFSLIRLLRDFGLDVHLSSDDNPQPKTAAMCLQTRKHEQKMKKFARLNSMKRSHKPISSQTNNRGHDASRCGSAQHASARQDDNTKNEPVEILPFEKNTYIPVVSNYVYVGSNVNDQLTDDYEVIRKIKSASCMLGLLRKRVLGPRTTSNRVKKTIYLGMILGVLLYGSETWILTKTTELLLQSFHRRATRTMNSINLWHTRKYSITSQTLENRLGIGSMRDNIDKRVLGWLGHMTRMGPHRWPKQLLHSYIAHPRPVGAPPKTYGRQIREALVRKKVDLTSWTTLAKNRNS